MFEWWLLFQPHSYHFVQRYGRCFHPSDVKWVYSCTCDVNRARLVSSLSTIVDYSYDDLCKMPEFAECIHIQAAVIIAIQLDAVHYVTASVEFMGTYMYWLTLNDAWLDIMLLLWQCRSLLWFGTSRKPLWGKLSYACQVVLKVAHPCMCIDKIGKSGYKAIVGIDDLSQGPQLHNNIPWCMGEGYGSRMFVSVCVCMCLLPH